MAFLQGSSRTRRSDQGQPLRFQFLFMLLYLFDSGFLLQVFANLS